MTGSAAQPADVPRLAPRFAPAATASGTLLMAAALGLGGCGQTGPLYLPDSGTVVTRPAPTAPAPTPAATPAATPAPPDAASAPTAPPPPPTP